MKNAALVMADTRHIYMNMAKPSFRLRRGGSAYDRARQVARLRRLAWLIDGVMRVPGSRFRFGLNSLIGLPPGAGDAALAVISLYFVFEAVRLGAPRRLIYRMLANVAVETALGTVPVLGDFLDMAWKANLRNVEILERHFQGVAAE